MLSRIKKIISCPADLIAVYLFTVYPYVRFNTGWPARKFYLTVVFLIAMLWELIRLIRRRDLACLRADGVSVLSLALGASLCLTAVFSKYGYLACDPKHSEEGAVIWCVYIAIFLLFRRQYAPKRSHLLLFLLSGYVQCLLVIINLCVYNLFGPNCSLYGNYNILGSAMSLFYALNLFMLTDEDDKTVRFIHYVLAFFFSVGLILCRSDNTLLCVAAMLGVLPFLKKITAAVLKKLLKLAGLVFLAMAAVHLLAFLPAYERGGLASTLLSLALGLSPVLTGALGILLFALQALLPKDAPLPRLTKSLRIAVIGILLLVTVCLILVNCFGISFGPADSILLLDDSWGTRRGQIWRFCLRTYREFSTPLQKVFGAGINSTPYLTWDFMPELANGYCTAHNIFIQWLLEGGIIGLLLFCLFLFFSLKGCLKSGNKYKALALGMVTVILASSAVTAASPDITPFLFVFLSLCAAKEKSAETAAVPAE